MSQHVCSGALVKCSMGTAPATLNVLPNNKTLTSAPTATIMDGKPMVNISPCLMCRSPANPAVAAATAAAMGVLTPMPCVPATAVWVPGKPQELIGNMPALNNQSKAICPFGGVVEVVSPGQATAMN